MKIPLISISETPSRKGPMKTNGNRNGFSLVEVLVAASILIVIVLMLGMLFQQTGLAWRTGAQRANNYMEVRAFVGTLQRDASAAVDQASVNPQLRALLGGSQQFKAFPLSFYTLSGTGFEEDDPDKTPLRALSYITYSQNGTRTMKTLAADGSVWDYGHSSGVDVKKVFSVSKVAASLEEVKAIYPKDDENRLPLSVRLKISIQPTGESYDIGAESAGPDGKFGDSVSDEYGKDDIRTWVDQ